MNHSLRRDKYMHRKAFILWMSMVIFWGSFLSIFIPNKTYAHPVEHISVADSTLQRLIQIVSSMEIGAIKGVCDTIVSEGIGTAPSPSQGGGLELNTPTNSAVKISKYDHLFIAAAKELGWDWTILAAIARHESHFKPNVSGGLMGIMPATARKYGYTRQQVKDPKVAVYIATRCLASLLKAFARIPNTRDRIYFVLASYVSGSGHVLDAQKVTQQYGGNPQEWDDVQPYILKMEDPKYYKSKGVRYGRFNGKHTVRYVTTLIDNAKGYSERIWAAENKSR